MEKSLYFSKSVLLIIFMSFISYTSVFAQYPCYDPSLIYPDGACLFIYAPVCGCNGVDYSNDCFSNQAGYNYTNGKCGCDAPTDVYASNSGAITSKEISWYHFAEAIDYEVVYRPFGVNTWTTVTSSLVANLYSSKIQTQIDNLEVDKLYRYKIRAYCQFNGWTDYSPVKSFRTSKCKAPNNITFTQLNNHRIRLNWNQSSYSEKYQIFYREAGSSNTFTKALIGLQGRTYKILKNMLPATNYEFKVRSFCDTAYGPFSPLEYFTTSASGNPRLAVHQNIFSLEQMSPNPATNNLHFDLLLSQEKTIHLSVVDLMGREIISLEKTFQEGISQYDLNIDELNNGYYVLLMNDGEQLISEKFVKVGR